MNTLIYKMTQKELFNYLEKRLKKLYKHVIVNKDNFIYCKGTIPIMLIAHLDTVHTKTPIKIEKLNGKYFSSQGLGSDDRAGVDAIIEIIQRGYRPHVLFTCDEEIGASGAKVASKTLKIEGVNLLLELDRMGFKNYVTYSCDNKEMNKYVESFGIKEDYGSFSDISIIAPKWDIGAVNIAIGYYNQHTKGEYLVESEYMEMVNIVCNMLDNPPIEKFEYIEENSFFDSYGYYSDYIEIGIDDLIDNYVDDRLLEEFLLNSEYYKEIAIKAIIHELNMRL